MCEFISGFHENEQALLTLKHGNIILRSPLLRMLDNHTRKRFEDGRLDSRKFPNAEELIRFMKKKYIHLEAVEEMVLIRDPNEPPMSWKLGSVRHYPRS